MQKVAILFLCLSFGCAKLKKDNEAKAPASLSSQVVEQFETYSSKITDSLDDKGLVEMEGSIGDSALFSCLAKAATGISFDPAMFFVEGKPIRHPDIAPGISKTPVSKDMVNGLLWCLYAIKDDRDAAKKIVEELIDYGKANKITLGVEIGWKLCSSEDKNLYNISDENYAGRCIAPASVVKDVYRVAKLLGIPCDSECSYYSTVGANLPVVKSGFERHLAVLSTVRNGLIEGAINDNSLEQLKQAAEDQPKNALYQAAYHTFTDGDQTEAFNSLLDQQLFPKNELPTSQNYCTGYLFQRDYPSSDWEPCQGANISEGRGVDWLFAAALALGKLTRE